MRGKISSVYYIPCEVNAPTAYNSSLATLFIRLVVLVFPIRNNNLSRRCNIMKVELMSDNAMPRRRAQALLKIKYYIVCIKFVL